MSVPQDLTIPNCLAGWYAVAESTQLKKSTTAFTLAGTPLVLFRNGEGQCVALLDRCPHRNVPLSLGKVNGARLECAYHGWQFDADGACRHVPGLTGESEHATRNVPSFATHESDGWVWVFSRAGIAPHTAPYRIPHADESGYLTVRHRVIMDGPLDAVAENALDVPHTAFLHGGLFRSPKQRKPIEVIIRGAADRVEAEFIGEDRPSGLVGKLLAPGGGGVFHCDRFILPCIAQVEYRLGEGTHVITSAALTPITPQQTEIMATVCIRVPIGAKLIKPVLLPIALRIARQDASILQNQSSQVARFGEERFVSTEIDVLGLRIKKLLREARQQDAADGSAQIPAELVEERRITMLV